MNYFYLLYLLVALDGGAASPEPVEAPVCSAHGPLYAVEQFASRLRLASLPICPTDGSHDAAGAEILSFEEWKALQFELQQQQQSNGSSSSSSPPTTTTAAGGNDTSTTPSEPDDAAPEHPSPPATESAAPSKLPSLKDRYNYASTDCSARITSSHRGAKSADSILSHKKDRYMLSPCSAKEQHVVVELCDDIRIDTVQLANFEFFSGVFRKFSVSVSVDAIAWEHAGEYEAKNVRGVQVCLAHSARSRSDLTLVFPPPARPAQLLSLRTRRLQEPLRQRVLLPRLAPARLRSHADGEVQTRAGRRASAHRSTCPCSRRPNNRRPGSRTHRRRCKGEGQRDGGGTHPTKD